MTQRPSKLEPAAAEATSAPGAETERLYLEQAAPSESEPDPRAFDPGKFSRIEFSLEERQKMLQVKLPRLEPECYLDTIPPAKALAAPLPLLETERLPPVNGPSSTAAAVSGRLRLPQGLALAFLVGALVLLTLVLIARFWNRELEPNSVPPTSSNPATNPPQPLVSSAPELTVPSPPATALDPAAHAVPATPSPDEVEHGATSIHSKPPMPSKMTRPALVSPPAVPPSSPLTITAPAPLSPPSAASASPGPSWVNPR